MVVVLPMEKVTIRTGVERYRRQTDPVAVEQALLGK